MDFKLDIERDRIWMPVEAERELYRRGYSRAYKRWFEDDHMIYLLDPPVSAGSTLNFQKGTGTLELVMHGGAFIFTRTIVIKEGGGFAPQSLRARLAAFPTSVLMVATEDQERPRGAPDKS